MDNYVVRLKRLWSTAPGVLLGVAIGIGIALMLFGAVFGTRLPGAPGVGSLPWFADLLGKLGALFVISGFVAAVTRFLAASGAFRDALSDLLVSDAVLENRNDLPQLWQRLTQRIYLPGFISRTDEDRVFVQRVHVAIERSLTYNEPFFIRDVHNFVTVRWHDEASGILELEDRTTFELVPFLGAAPVTYRTTFIPTSGLTLGDYEVQERGLTVRGQPVQLKLLEERGHEIGVLDLSGATSYEVRRTRVTRWHVDRDPYIHFSSPYVASRNRFELDCHANGLTTSFLEIGTEGAFEDHLEGEGRRTGRTGNQRRSCDSVLLPGQGFVVIFQRDNVSQEAG